MDRNALKRELKKRGLTQVAVAERLGWTPQDIGNMFDGRDPCFSSVVELARAIGCSVDALVCGDVEPFLIEGDEAKTAMLRGKLVAEVCRLGLAELVHCLECLERHARGRADRDSERLRDLAAGARRLIGDVGNG